MPSHICVSRFIGLMLLAAFYHIGALLPSRSVAAPMKFSRYY